MTIQSYQDLDAWKEGMSLAKECYVLTQAFPREEMFGLTSQIRRAASSIPANIAEGYGREHTKEYVRFLRIAQGSLKELETHLLLSQEVLPLPPLACQTQLRKCDQVGRIFRGLIRALQAKLE